MENEPLICNKPECTLAQTGTCILDHLPDSCPDRLKSLVDVEKLINDVFSQKEISQEVEHVQFSSSYTLSIQQVEELMRGSYCNTIGILGVPNSGKTACLVSFYLKLAHNQLEGYQFRDSKTLRAFEEISIGARTWSEGRHQEELTLHTEISDERSAGFLHLRLFSEKSNRTFDLLLPDLPGEWSSSLIESNRTDRLGFLKSADCIWLMINGHEIEEQETRYSILHKLEMLIKRLGSFLVTQRPKLILVITHKDRCGEIITKLEKIKRVAEALRFQLEVKEIASFSENNDVHPGTGISELIDEVFAEKVISNEFWPDTMPLETFRQALRFQNNL